YLDVIDIGSRGDFARQHNQPSVAQGFSRYASVRILGKNGIQNGIGNLVGDLIGMAFGYGFGCEKEVVVCHGDTSCRNTGCPAQRLNETRCTSDACIAVEIRARRFSGFFYTPIPENGMPSLRKLSVNSAIDAI